MDELQNISSKVRHASILLQKLKIDASVDNLVNLLTALQLLENIKDELAAIQNSIGAEKEGDDCGEPE